MTIFHSNLECNTVTLYFKEAIMQPFRCTAAAVMACALSLPAGAGASQPAWQPTWYAAPQPAWDDSFILPTNVPARLSGQTVREIVRISVGGTRVRVVLSNRYGTVPVQIGAVRVAHAADGGAIRAATGRAVMFSGRAAVTLAPGASAVSDPVAFAVAPLTRLAVSTWFPDDTPVQTFHWGEQQTAYVGQGDVGQRAAFDPVDTFHGRAFLTGILVDAPAPARTVIAFGDSITDGNGSTPDANRRWPDVLAQRLAGRGVAVVNAGISGARLLGDKMGVNALARFEQDVLGQPGTKTVILLMGINDIGWPGSPFAPSAPPMTAAQMIAAYQQLIAMAHLHQVRIVGATVPPFEGALAGTPFAGHYSVAKERVRLAVNAWIRTAGAFDVVVDFDALLRDPARPARMLPAFDSGDHLHPGDTGYRAMAEAIALETLFAE